MLPISPDPLLSHLKMGERMTERKRPDEQQMGPARHLILPPGLQERNNPDVPVDAGSTATAQNTVQPKLFAFDPDRATKYLALLGLIAYVLGILITNTYLLQFSVSEFTFLKPRFIYTGFFALAMLCLPSALCVGCFLISYHSKKRRSIVFPSLYGLLLGYIWYLIVFFTPFSIFSIPTRGFIFFDLISHISFIWVAGLLGYFTIYAAIIPRNELTKYVESYEKFRRSRIPRFLLRFSREDVTQGFARSYLYIAMFISIGLALISLQNFSFNLYPLIPEQFGGGQSSKTRFLFLKDEEVRSARCIGLSIPPDSLLSDSVELIFEGDDTYVIRLPNQQTAQIQKKLISGVLTVPLVTTTPTPYITDSELNGSPIPLVTITPTPPPTTCPPSQIVSSPTPRVPEVPHPEP
jgi:hypothetical protein